MLSFMRDVGFFKVLCNFAQHGVDKVGNSKTVRGIESSNGRMGFCTFSCVMALANVTGLHEILEKRYIWPPILLWFELFNRLI